MTNDYKTQIEKQVQINQTLVNHNQQEVAITITIIIIIRMIIISTNSQ